LKQIRLQPDEKQARNYGKDIIEKYTGQSSKAIECLEDGDRRFTAIVSF